MKTTQHLQTDPKTSQEPPRTFRRGWFALPGLAAASLALAGCKTLMNPSQPAPPVGTNVPSTASAVAAPAASTFPGAANTNAVLEAANAFLTTLSREQQAVVQIPLTAPNAARWSNFPTGVVARNGVYLRDLNSQQVAAALKVARLALSEEGFNRFQEVRAADDVYAKSSASRGPGGGGPRGGGPRGGGPGGRGPGGGGFGGPGGPPPGGFGGPGGEENAGRGPRGGGFGGGAPGGGAGGGGAGGGGAGGGGAGGGGGNLFGAGNYMIAFLGEPSKSAPWLLQLGGHHLAFNILYKGARGTSTPYHVGVEPVAWTDAEGKKHTPLETMRVAVDGLLKSMSPQQLTQAKLETRFNDVYVGPGRDGQFPAREGVPVSELSAASKDWVKRAVAAWTGDSAQGAAYRKLYEAELSQTKVAYSGTATLGEAGDYVRIDGPHLWIEFSCQGSRGEFPIHYHTIWRDRATDYGAEFTF